MKIMENYQVLLFDLDGTLTDSREGIQKSILHALSKMGIKEEDPGRLVDFIGPPLPDSFKRHYGLSDTAARDAVSFYREYYAARGIYEAVLYPGILELLRLLHENRKDLVLATSKATVYAQQVAEHFDFDKYLSLVAGSNFDLTMLQKSEIVKYALQKLGYYGEKGIIMIGDRADDIEAARTNNIDSIAVTYGYGSIEELRGSNPTYVADSVKELRGMLVQE